MMTKIKNDNLKTVSLDTMIDKHIGIRGTERHEAFENELNSDLKSKHSRKEKDFK